jgi:hypothetical protein
VQLIILWFVIFPFLYKLTIMSDNSEPSMPKRVVRTITLTEDDLTMLDDIERVLSKTGNRVKTDSKLIRAAINVASSALHGKPFDVNEVAERVVREDGRSLSKLIAKHKG